MIYEYNDINSREKRMTIAKQAVMSEKIMVDIPKIEEEWEKGHEKFCRSQSKVRNYIMYDPTGLHYTDDKYISFHSFSSLRFVSHLCATFYWS